MLITVLIFLAILSVLIFVHELGHFLMARRNGMKVEEFGFGYPPRVMTLFNRGETEYTLNLLPLGGFVRILGENGEEGVGRKLTRAEDKRAFYNQPLRARFMVLIAGVVMNVVLGVAVFMVVYSVVGIPNKTNKVLVAGVVADSPASQVGLMEGDWITAGQSADGVQVVRFTELNQFIAFIDQYRGQQVELMVSRAGEEKTESGILKLEVVPRANPPGGQGALGVAVSNVEMVQYPWYQMPFRAAIVGGREAYSWGVTILTGLRDMVVKGVSQGQVPTDVAGPIGILQLTGTISKAGWVALLQFMGILSINLAVLNVLPLPALDGGRIMFLVYEATTGRRANAKVEGYTNFAGMLLLLTGMVLITISDFQRVLSTTAIGMRLIEWWPF